PSKIKRLSSSPIESTQNETLSISNLSAPGSMISYSQIPNPNIPPQVHRHFQRPPAAQKGTPYLFATECTKSLGLPKGTPYLFATVCVIPPEERLVSHFENFVLLLKRTVMDWAI